MQAQPDILVIKIGGNIVDDATALKKFLADFAALKIPRVLIHGGGKIASRIGDQLGMVSQYKDGRRITDDQTVDLVTMVYGGLINKQLVAALQALGVNAWGLTGADGNLIPASKRPVGEIDYGWVGDVKPDDLPAEQWKAMLDAGFVPVVAPLTHDGQGHMLNTNADTIASSIAIALSKKASVRLVYCFEKKGVLESVEDDHSVIPLINRSLYQSLKSDGKLFAGILPKIDNAFAAIEAGVQEVLIGHADQLQSNAGGQPVGTLIKA